MLFSGLIAGLGNPGTQYLLTRHNFGFLALDVLLSNLNDGGQVQEITNKKAPCQMWKVAYNNQLWLLAKPLTFMNLSGEALSFILHYYKIEPATLTVLHDELDLAFGRMKMKFGGGNAGHNGLKSISQHLGNDFHRIRLGVGKPLGFDTSSYVLSRFNADEQTHLPTLLAETSKITCMHMQGRTKDAQTLCNSFSL